MDALRNHAGRLDLIDGGRDQIHEDRIVPIVEEARRAPVRLRSTTATMSRAGITTSAQWLAPPWQ
jgi:hypothetical protein